MISKEIRYLDEEPAGSDQISETFRLIRSGLEDVPTSIGSAILRQSVVMCQHDVIGCYTGMMRLAEVDVDSEENESGLLAVVETGKLNEYLIVDSDTSGFPGLLELSHDIKSYYLYAQQERMAMRRVKRTSAADIDVDFLSEADRLIFTDPAKLLGETIVSRKEVRSLNTGLATLVPTIVNFS